METTDKHTYQPDDYVSYAGSGVCRVIGQETQSPDGIQEIQYYKLQRWTAKTPPIMCQWNTQKCACGRC